MLKETETEETVVFFVTFLSLVTFQLGGGGPGPLGPPSSYAYVLNAGTLPEQNFWGQQKFGGQSDVFRQEMHEIM